MMRGLAIAHTAFTMPAFLRAGADVPPGVARTIKLPSGELGVYVGDGQYRSVKTPHHIFKVSPQYMQKYMASRPEYAASRSSNKKYWHDDDEDDDKLPPVTTTLRDLSGRMSEYGHQWPKVERLARVYPRI